LNAKTLKPAADEMEAVAKLGSRAKLANLVPIPSAGELALGSGEVANHVQPLCIMMEDLKREASRLAPRTWPFLYALTTQPASVTGYKLVSSGSTFTTKQIWHMHLSSDDYPQRILRAAAHPSNEHVHSIGRILGDRNVMYKYINPNLLAVRTEGVSAMEGHSIISMYLVDTVGGQIIHSVVHRKAVEPTSLVVSENWVLYSVYNQRSLRNEFTVMELFEPKQTTDNLVPSPWEIMLNSPLDYIGIYLIGND
uniref:EMC1_C domain-containing protein n=1 Tax=Hymenolepis diminuta TaxID=6216 RepID=A0A0R3SMK1_HYMDI